MRTISFAAAALPLALMVGCGQTPEIAGENAEPPASTEAAPAPSGSYTTNTHHFEEVAPGVFFVTYTVQGFFNSNSMVIVGDTDVIVVDSHITPAAGRELIAGIGKITSLPISVLVNTHFHYDHAHGNQVFENARIIGHEFTRLKMAGRPLQERTFTDYLGRISAGIEQAQTQLTATEDAEEKQGIETRLAAMQAHLATVEETAPVAPNITLNERITLYRGEREIQLVFCGRAHTGGDVVVYLPNERLVFTGDMMLGGPSWLGDGHVDEWPETLENLKALDFDLILPGHGPPFTDRALIDHVQDFYRELWAQTKELHKRGKTVAEAAQAVDLTAFEDRLPGRRPGFDPQAVARMYQLLNERGA